MDLIQCNHKCPHSRRCQRYTEVLDKTRARVGMIDYMQLQGEEAKKTPCPMFKGPERSYQEPEPEPEDKPKSKPNQQAADEISYAEKVDALDAHNAAAESDHIDEKYKDDPKLAELVKLCRRSSRGRRRGRR